MISREEILEASLRVACLGLARGSTGRITAGEWEESILAMVEEHLNRGTDPITAIVLELGADAFDETLRQKL